MAQVFDVGWGDAVEAQMQVFEFGELRFINVDGLETVVLEVYFLEAF